MLSFSVGFVWHATGQFHQTGLDATHKGKFKQKLSIYVMNVFPQFSVTRFGEILPLCLITVKSLATFVCVHLVLDKYFLAYFLKKLRYLENFRGY